MVFSIFIKILIEHSVSRQWRPWSDTAFCSVWSGSVLFAHVSQKGHQAYMTSVQGILDNLTVYKSLWGYYYPGLKLYWAEDKLSCSRTKHSASGGLKPAAPQSQVVHSTTVLLLWLYFVCLKKLFLQDLTNEIGLCIEKLTIFLRNFHTIWL